MQNCLTKVVQRLKVHLSASVSVRQRGQQLGYISVSLVVYLSTFSSYHHHPVVEKHQLVGAWDYVSSFSHWAISMTRV